MKILVAEDDLTSRRILQIFLEKLDYEVIAVSNGREAVQVLSAEDAPQLAILDWMMPELDGLQVCQQIRQASREAYTYVLLVTAKARQNDLVEGMESGADDYIRKPYNLQELRVRLRAGRRILGV